MESMKLNKKIFDELRLSAKNEITRIKQLQKDEFCGKGFLKRREYMCLSFLCLSQSDITKQIIFIYYDCLQSSKWRPFIPDCWSMLDLLVSDMPLTFVCN